MIVGNSMHVIIKENGLRMVNAFPQLETERLILRKMKVADAPALFHVWSDPSVTKFTNLKTFTKVDEAKKMIEYLNNLALFNPTFRWGIVLKETNEAIGSCGFNYWILEGGFKGELGCELNRRYWRKGYMTEALRRIIDYGFNEKGLNRIESLVQPENIASRKMFENIGFQHEGLLRDCLYTQGKFVSLNMFYLLRSEYQNT